MEVSNKFYDIMNRAFEKEGLTFNQDIYSKFMTYMQMIKEWNEKINLTAITEEDEMVKKHFIDSIKCYRFTPFKNLKNILDVGTGAGFPGLPIKIVDSEKKVTLLDSLNKRIIFLNEVIRTLNLQKIDSIHSRAEDLARKVEFRETFDGVVSRAVANLAVLSEFCIPYTKVGGYFIAMKGPSIETELAEAKTAVGVLGGKIEDLIQVEIEDTELKHNIVIIKKVKSTPGSYPRKAGSINKNPIR